MKLFYSLLMLFACYSCLGQTVYVSPEGNDRNPGTLEKPLGSLKKAQEKVRAIKGPVEVLLRGGVYYLKETIVFTPKDSRKPGWEVTYKPYRDEKVIISGAATLNVQWKPFKGGVFQAKIPGELVFDQLFLNGRQQQLARYPNYNPEIRIFNGYAADAIAPARVKQWKNPEGGIIHAMHKHEWGGYQYIINGKNDQDELGLDGGYQNNRQMGMHDQYRYVENVFEELDTIGEWYFNAAEKMLYYYPEAGSELKESKLEIPQLKHLFEFRGSEKSPVSFINIQGFELRHTLRTFMETREPLLRSDWAIYRGGAVLFEGAENCRLTNCFLNSVGGNAVFFSNYNRNNVVSGCHIAYAGASGVCFVGNPEAVRSPSFEYGQFVPLSEMDTIPGPKSNNYPADCIVENTLMYGLGRVEKQVAGVEIAMAMDIKVIHNTIYDVPRSGINIGDGTWGGHEIAYNDVFNTVLETGDHGAFNSWGRDRFWHPDFNTMAKIAREHPQLILADAIKTTAIHDNRFRCDHGWDIDLDDGSGNYHIYNNVCLNGGLKLREGFYRKVENNVILNNSFHPHVWFENSGDEFQFNIVSRAYFPIGINFWGKTIDHNIFPDQQSQAEVQKNGTDASSLYGDPDFMNPDQGDYRVKPDSKALQAGFKNFAMDRFGVTSPALQSMAKKVKLPTLVYYQAQQGDEPINWLGLKIKDLKTLGERSATGMADETGVLILDVAKDSPYALLFRPNDVILACEGNQVKNKASFLEEIDRVIDRKIKLKLFRNQAVQELEIERTSAY
jgi:hypothetical protein